MSLFNGIRVIKNESLPPNTMMVSPDVFDMLKGGVDHEKRMNEIQQKADLLKSLIPRSK